MSVRDGDPWFVESGGEVDEVVGAKARLGTCTREPVEGFLATVEEEIGAGETLREAGEVAVEVEDVE